MHFTWHRTGGLAHRSDSSISLRAIPARPACTSSRVLIARASVTEERPAGPEQRATATYASTSAD